MALANNRLGSRFLYLCRRIPLRSALAKQAGDAKGVISYFLTCMFQDVEAAYTHPVHYIAN